MSNRIQQPAVVAAGQNPWALINSSTRILRSSSIYDRTASRCRIILLTESVRSKISTDDKSPQRLILDCVSIPLPTHSDSLLWKRGKVVGKAAGKASARFSQNCASRGQHNLRTVGKELGRRLRECSMKVSSDELRGG